MITGNAWVNGAHFFSDTPRFVDVQRRISNRGNIVVDPNLNPGVSWLIVKSIGKDEEGDNYYQAVPELPIINALGKGIKYPKALDGRYFYKLNKRWIVAWYPVNERLQDYNTSRYIFSIWNKNWEVAMLSRGSGLIR